MALSAILGAALRRDLPFPVVVGLALLTPVLAGVVHFVLGIDDSLTIMQATLLALPFGGALVFALSYNPSG